MRQDFNLSYKLYVPNRGQIEITNTIILKYAIQMDTGYEATNKDVLQKAVKVAINIGPAMVVYWYRIG